MTDLLPAHSSGMQDAILLAHALVADADLDALAGLARALASRCSMAVITNDIYTREDADYLMRAQVPARYSRCGDRRLPAYGHLRRCVDQSGGRFAGGVPGS